jgi:elongation factor G
MAHKTDVIRNVALVGHSGSGKTMLADTMLYRAKAVDRRGNVDDGSSFSDYDEEAKRQKHTIDATLLYFEHGGKLVNLLDSPGYPDFVGQALCALNAVETAVVVLSAAHGVEVNARRLFNEAKGRGLARFIVFNKMDADNIDFAALVDAVRKTFGNSCVLFNVPVGAGPKFAGVVSVLNPPSALPSGLAYDFEAARSLLIEAVAESDDALAEKYLSDGTLTEADLQAALPKAIAAGAVVPIYCASGKNDSGVAELMAGLVEYAPSPLTGLQRQTEDGQKVDPNGKAIGQVFKVINDKFVGSMSFIRLYGGKIANDAAVFNVRAGKSFRAHGILQVQGKATKPLAEVVAGDLLAIAKIEDLRIGDTVGAEGIAKLPHPRFPTPMFGLAVEPKARGDEQKISGSLAKMAEEDPTFRVTRDTQTKELVMTGMSQLHLDTVQHRLKARNALEIVTREPKIAYRETITANGEANYRHKKQSGGRGQFGEVHLRVYPLPREIQSDEQCRAEFMNKARFPHLREDHSKYDDDHNFAFVDSVVGGTVPNQYIPAVYKGCLEVLDRGALAGYRLQDLACEVHFGKDHPVDSSEAAFKIASRIAFKNAILNARPVLLEPIVNLEVTIPSKYVGSILGDLNTKRARIENQDSLPGDLQVIKARAPLAEVMRYAAQLGSITQGQGSYTMEFSHYDQVPGNVQQQIVAKVGKLKDEEEE